MIRKKEKNGRINGQLTKGLRFHGNDGERERGRGSADIKVCPGMEIPAAKESDLFDLLRRNIALGTIQREFFRHFSWNLWRRGWRWMDIKLRMKMRREVRETKRGRRG